LIENLFQERAVRLLAERVLEPGDVPRLGDAGLGVDADEGAESGVSAEFAEHGLGVDVPQDVPQDDDPPEDVDGIVVSAFASGVSQGIEELGVGKNVEQFFDGP
jgi:hypothetical protein